MNPTRRPCGHRSIHHIIDADHIRFTEAGRQDDSLCGEPRVLRGLLSDLAPHCSGEVNIIILALEWGIPPEHPYYNPDIPRRQYDPERARFSVGALMLDRGDRRGDVALDSLTARADALLYRSKAAGKATLSVVSWKESGKLLA